MFLFFNPLFVNIDPCLAVWAPIYPIFENNVDPDQLASDKAIWSGSTLLSTPTEKNMLTTRMLQVNTGQKFGEECST